MGRPKKPATAGSHIFIIGEASLKATKSNVEAVIREFRDIGPKAFSSLYRYDQSTKYDLLYRGHRYPPKAIYNVALKRALGENDKTGNARGLAGGKAVNNPLRLLGFEVVPKSKLEADLDIPDAGADDYAQRTIAYRKGQTKFRSLLKAVYEKSCAITGCGVDEILDACHVKPYSDVKDYAVSNGILLRTDIHTLFDVGLIKICPDDMRAYVHRSITDAEYRKLDGTLVRQPANKNNQLNKEFLMARWKRPAP